MPKSISSPLMKHVLPIFLFIFASTAFADSDGDGVPDKIDNCSNISNLDQNDADFDGVGDICDGDDDNDTLPDAWEVSSGRNPLIPDYLVEASESYLTCGVDEGGLLCWGLGAVYAPVLSEVIDVALGSGHGCAIKSNKEVQCWGFKNDYQQQNPPELIEPRRLAAGDEHTCALDSEGVKCWGSNFYNESVVPELSEPYFIAAGARNTCALDSTGIVCWGQGFGEFQPPTGNNFIAIDVGNAGISFAHACAISLDDSGPTSVSKSGTRASSQSSNLFCWGYNGQGQAVVPSFEGSRVRQVSLGRSHSCALTDEAMRCWGSNIYGQSDVPALLAEARISDISSGAQHVCSLSDAGVNCWGWNSNGQTSVPVLNFDSDLDGSSNLGGADAFPNDPAASVDTDGDGMPDDWNEGKSQAESTSDPVLVLDDDDDNDGVSDEQEAIDGTDPLDINICIGCDSLFFDDFEGQKLGAWRGKEDFVSHGGVIAEDPLDRSNRALTFNRTWVAGDIFSLRQMDISSLDKPQLNFKYLGYPNEGSDPQDTGGFIGITSELDLSDASKDGTVGFWLAATRAYSSSDFETIELVDDGQWHEYTIDLTMFPSEKGLTRIYLMLEDFVGIAGDAFFDDIRVYEGRESIDTDNDGYPDADDAFPDDPAASVDTDGDGMPDDWNDGKTQADSTSDPLLILDEDDDNDTVDDLFDAFPLDVTEWADSDNDGIGDNTDVCPEISSADQTDSDADGFGDACDLYPEDPSFWSMRIEDALANIVDPRLRHCLEIASNELDQQVTQVAQLTDLTCSPIPPEMEGIGTLQGIENFTNLKTIRIWGGQYNGVFASNPISDLGPLALLKNLNELDLGSTKVSDLEPITSLNELTQLGLWNSEVQDLEPLRSMRGLVSLTIANDGSSEPTVRLTDVDIAPIAELAELTRLYLDHQSISDLSTLSGLQNLYALSLSGNQIADLSALPEPSSAVFGFPSYLVLKLNQNPIEDYTALKTLGVGYLGISIADDAAYEFASGFDPFIGFLAYQNGSAPKDFKFLTANGKQDSIFVCIQCDLGASLVEMESLLENVVGIPQLHLLASQIKDTAPLAQLSLAESAALNLSFNEIADITPLKDLNIRQLTINSNPLTCSKLAEFESVSEIEVVIDRCLPDLEDDDGDSVQNGLDAFPWNAFESEDTDGDFIGNNADSDDDNDKVDDLFDAFPLDPAESVDTDNDGVGDNSDVFPTDPNEAYDYDDDGIGDNSDNCMLVANSDQTNTDDDAEGNECDFDDDNDGVSDEQELLDGTDPLDRLDCLSCYAPLDVDADGQVKALTDGLIIIRHLFGFSGNSLVAGALGSNAQRTDPAEIKAHIDSLGY